MISNVCNGKKRGKEGGEREKGREEGREGGRENELKSRQYQCIHMNNIVFGWVSMRVHSICAFFKYMCHLVVVV